MEILHSFIFHLAARSALLSSSLLHCHQYGLSCQPRHIDYHGIAKRRGSGAPFARRKNHPPITVILPSDQTSWKTLWTCNRKDILPSRKKNDGTEQEIGSRLMSDDTLFPLKIRSQNEGLASNDRIVAIVQRKGMVRTGDVKTIPCQWITKGGIVTFSLFLAYFSSSVQC